MRKATNIWRIKHLWGVLTKLTVLAQCLLMHWLKYVRMLLRTDRIPAGQFKSKRFSLELHLNRKIKLYYSAVEVHFNSSDNGTRFQRWIQEVLVRLTPHRRAATRTFGWNRFISSLIKLTWCSDRHGSTRGLIRPLWHERAALTDQIKAGKRHFVPRAEALLFFSLFKSPFTPFDRCASIHLFLGFFFPGGFPSVDLTQKSRT